MTTTEDDTSLASSIRSGQVVLACRDLAAELRFFTSRLGFRLNMIVPADAPVSAVISGHGLTLRLEEQTGDATAAAPGRLRLLCDRPALGLVAGGKLHSPSGTVIDLFDAQPPMEIPDGRQAFVISRLSGSGGWGTGRAGMQYRDLVPGRFGGRFVASHIRIPVGGPVPDYVHFHKVRFQMIYCKKGWAKLVYEDQGDPFLLEAGDCVLQPPEIRHRVLEASDGLEVIEIGCPAVHETFADHNMTLPTGRLLLERLYGAGQRFVRHVAGRATWEPWRRPGYECRDTGIAAATNGLAGARVVRTSAERSDNLPSHQGEFLLIFVLSGAALLSSPGLGPQALGAGDSCTIPAGEPCSLATSSGTEFLEVSLPAVLT